MSEEPEEGRLFWVMAGILTAVLGTGSFVWAVEENHRLLGAWITIPSLLGLLALARKQIRHMLLRVNFALLAAVLTWLLFAYIIYDHYKVQDPASQFVLIAIAVLVAGVALVIGFDLHRGGSQAKRERALATERDEALQNVATFNATVRTLNDDNRTLHDANSSKINELLQHHGEVLAAERQKVEARAQEIKEKNELYLAELQRRKTAEAEARAATGEKIKAQQNLPFEPKISLSKSFASYNASSKGYPLKFHAVMVNDSMEPVEVRISGYKPLSVPVKELPRDVIQLPFRGKWLPEDEGVDKVAVLAGASFRAWIAPDHTIFSWEQLERMRGKIGTLELSVNGKEVKVQL